MTDFSGCAVTLEELLKLLEDGVEPQAEVLTMAEGIARAAEEVWNYHHRIGFPHDLTHHCSMDSVKPLSHTGNYDDKGNWCGSILMMSLLFHSEALGCESLLPLLNQNGDREPTLKEWGAEYQKSGQGVDNYRTNLLEAMMGYMGREGRSLQTAWRMIRKYSSMHAEQPREQLLKMALADSRNDILSYEDATMRHIAKQVSGGWENDDLVEQAYGHP